MEGGRLRSGARGVVARRVGALAELLQAPNNILAVEYLKAIYDQRLELHPLTVLRTGAQHDRFAEGNIRSASELRMRIGAGEDVSAFLPRAAAEIFARLTDGRYSGVVLDRTFHLSAEPADERVYRDAALLSAGASDQLYLAVRLAICRMVLPRDKAAPLILDDALANFDDQRLAAALDWLAEESRSRQILLFTCHRREGDYLRDRAHVISLN